jgi:hypothetical protein
VESWANFWGSWGVLGFLLGILGVWGLAGRGQEWRLCDVGALGVRPYACWVRARTRTRAHQAGAPARVRVVGKARERHQTAPDVNGSRRSLFASCEEFGGGLSDTLSSSTDNNIIFRATLLKRDLRCEVLGISHQHLARSGPRGMERRKGLAEIISRNYTGKLERLWGS